MTVLTFPAAVPAPNDMTLGITTNTQSGGRSPFDGTEQTLELPGARWAGELRWRDLAEAEWRALDAFLAQLAGRAGRFTWSPIAKFPRRGVATGTPLVKGGGQTGNTLLTDGWTNTAVAFYAGDLIGFTDSTSRSVMHRIVSDVSPAGGEATLTFAPPIRRSPADNAAINMTTPSPTWMLQRDDITADYTPGARGYSISVPIMEAIW